MTGSRLSILSVGQVAPYLRGITAAIKSAWANRKALVCLWGVNGERHWRQEVLRKWKALYCTPEWPGIGFPSNPMGKPHYRSLHRVITTGQWSSSDPLHLNDNITSLYSFFPLVWPDDDPCGIGMLSVEWCAEVTVEHVQDLAHASAHKNSLQHTCGPHPFITNCESRPLRWCGFLVSTGSWSHKPQYTATWHHQASKTELQHRSLPGWPPISQRQTMWDVCLDGSVYLPASGNSRTWLQQGYIQPHRGVFWGENEL